MKLEDIIESEKVNLSDFGVADFKEMAAKMKAAIDDDEAEDVEDAAVYVVDRDKRFDDISDFQFDQLTTQLVKQYSKMYK